MKKTKKKNLGVSYFVELCYTDTYMILRMAGGMLYVKKNIKACRIYNLWNTWTIAYYKHNNND